MRKKDNNSRIANPTEPKKNHELSELHGFSIQNTNTPYIKIIKKTS